MIPFIAFAKTPNKILLLGIKRNYGIGKRKRGEGKKDKIVKHYSGLAYTSLTFNS
jgi:hypothetical protein